jgi:hypothetical protein
MSPAVHCGSCPEASGSRIRLIVTQKGKPSAAHVIARSMAEPPSSSKNAKTWAMPSRDPRNNPKPTLLTAEQRKMLDAVPQSRPTSARRTSGFNGERSPLRFCLSLLSIPSGELCIDGPRSGSNYCVRNRKPESRFSPSLAGEVDDACAGQMRQPSSLLRPVTNGRSIADAATLTASLISARAQLARQFEQGIFISFVLVTGFA